MFSQIVLYTWNLTNLQNITGEQMGAYFGYSLASVDMDGDKLDDLVIGAPLYTDLSNNEGDYETGRVYVVYQGAGVCIVRLDVLQYFSYEYVPYLSYNSYSNPVIYHQLYTMSCLSSFSSTLYKHEN